VIVGFGPAGQRIAETLVQRYKSLLVVLELSGKSADVARAYGLPTYIGDATSAEVLEHLRVGAARAVAVTLPDPAAARQVIEQVHSLSPETPIVARARYHVYRWELMLAGAPVVVDEEDQVGLRMAVAVRTILRAAGDESAAANDNTRRLPE
jgi:CPA2 family monovalent cation:H+ antiporter-2